jgi:hypothetical protein
MHSDAGMIVAVDDFDWCFQLPALVHERDKPTC